MDTLLGMLGLSTRQQLHEAIRRKKRWHALVKDVFAQYYVKFRESSLDYLPELPQRWTPDWERTFRDELGEFMKHDLESIGELLEACGYGTERWDRLKDSGLPAFRQLIDRHLSALESGNGVVTDADLKTNDGYLELEAHLEEAELEVKQLRSGGRRALDRIRGFETQIDLLQKQLSDREDGVASQASDGDISSLFGPDEDVVEATADDFAARDREMTSRIEELEAEVKARDHTMAGLHDDVEKNREAIEAARRATSEARSGASAQAGQPQVVLSRDAELQAENEQLRRDMSGREQTIRTLRFQLEKFEEEMRQARQQLVEEVRKLSALTAGELEIKPTEELQGMDADQLLGYAREVAEDVDVRRQTLDEGLHGIDSIKQSFEENQRRYEEQQELLERQLEELRCELDASLERQKELEATEAVAADGAKEKGGTHGAAADSVELRDTVATQRQQLEMLATRVVQLQNSNVELNESNKKMYGDLESSVRRLIPLRRQIEELEALQDALQRYIREKHDRSFTMKKL